MNTWDIIAAIVYMVLLAAFIITNVKDIKASRELSKITREYNKLLTEQNEEVRKMNAELIKANQSLNTVIIRVCSKSVKDRAKERKDENND